MLGLRLVDTHMHLQVRKTGWYPTFETAQGPAAEHIGGDTSKLFGRDFTLDDYFEVSSGYEVLKLVHVTHAQTPPSWPDETRYVQTIFETHGVPHAIIGFTDFAQPVRQVGRELEEHAESPNFRGIRHTTGIDYTNEHNADCFRVMNDRALIYDTVVNEKTLPAAARLAKRFEKIAFIVEHTGWPSDAQRETFEAWRDGMRKMASVPNTAVKLSGLGMVIHPWTVEDFRPWVEAAIDIFGINRCMFGSNFPVDWCYSDYATLIEAFAEIVSGSSEDELDALFVSNAQEWYRI
jgi:predicted TIM-barrel fold metal-dependent hydrolase